MRTLFRTSYDKLDDKFYLICYNCGHSFTPPRSTRQSTLMTSVDPNSLPRSRPPLFRALTWSATAANHRIQKLSKQLSKFQIKVDRVFHPSTTSSSRIEPGAKGQNNSTLPGNNHRQSFHSLEDPVEHQHLLSVNNVHVAVVHNLSLTRGQIPKRNNVEPLKVNNKSNSPQNSNVWTSRPGRSTEFGLETRKTSSLDIFELTPLTGGDDEEAQRSSRSSNETLESGGNTVSPSPEWSSSSSWTSVTGDPVLPEEAEPSSSNTVTSPECRTRPVLPSDLTFRILEEEPDLHDASWFQAGIPREIALEILKNEVLGSFIVRESTTRSGCFALSVRVPPEFQPTGIAHYLIIRNKGYKIKGFTKEFGTLTSLVTHHSVMPELLPCPLYRPSVTVRVSRANSTDFVEPEKLLGPNPNSIQKLTTKTSTSTTEWTCTEF